MPWHQEPKKDVTSCESHGELQISVNPWTSEWGNLACEEHVSVR